MKTDIAKVLTNRRVLRIVGIYLATSLVVLRLIEKLSEIFGLTALLQQIAAVVLIAGLPAVVSLVWRRQSIIAVEGEDLEPAVPTQSEVFDEDGNLKVSSKLRARLADFALGGFVAIVISIVVAERMISSQITDDALASPDRSIAVLPFVNMSSDEEQEWFADGLTEELLNSLARTPDLLVAARTSSFAYKNTNDDITKIAAELGVAHVLEGSVRRGGDRLRITAQLIRASDGFHLWSETYDRTPADVIEIQEELAVKIAQALKTAMDPEALSQMVSTGTASVPAFEAYLQALSAWQRSDATGNEQLFLGFKTGMERAITVDPQFSLAHWRLSRFWYTQMQLGAPRARLTDVSPEERLANYKSAIEMAIATESDPAVRSHYLADSAFMDLRINVGLEHISEYLSHRPGNFEARMTKLRWLARSGRRDESREIALQLVRENSDSAYAMYSAVHYLRTLMFTAEAAQAARQALEDHRNDLWIKLYAHQAFIWDGSIDEARSLLIEIEGSGIDWASKQQASMRQACADGDTATAIRIFKNFAERYSDQSPELWYFYQLLGQKEPARELLKQYDTPSQLYSLAGFLDLPYFDSGQFPTLTATLSRHGFNPPPPVEIPYRCNVPASLL